MSQANGRAKAITIRRLVGYQCYTLCRQDESHGLLNQSRLKLLVKCINTFTCSYFYHLAISWFHRLVKLTFFLFNFLKKLEDMRPLGYRCIKLEDQLRHEAEDEATGKFMTQKTCGML